MHLLFVNAALKSYGADNSNTLPSNTLNAGEKEYRYGATKAGNSDYHP